MPAFKRISDGKIFTKNKDETYSIEEFKKEYPNNLHMTWSIHVMNQMVKEGCFEQIATPWEDANETNAAT